MNELKKIEITRIAHACVLLKIGSFTVLTDPWFSQRFGYYRGEPLGLNVKDLPLLDLIIVSHEHYDHYDVAALSPYPDKNVPFIVKNKTGHKARKAGFKNVIEMGHWDKWALGDLRITATPAKHKIPENTYIIEANGFTVFFGADTLFIPELAEISVKFPSIDVAFLSVNGLAIRPLFNQRVVMTDYEAALLCCVLKPRVAIPIHYTFTGGRFKDALLLKYSGSAQGFLTYLNQIIPSTKGLILPTGVLHTIEK